MSKYTELNGDFALISEFWGNLALITENFYLVKLTLEMGLQLLALITEFLLNPNLL